MMAKEKPPITVVGDVGGRIAIIVVGRGLPSGGRREASPGGRPLWERVSRDDGGAGGGTAFKWLRLARLPQAPSGQGVKNCN